MEPNESYDYNQSVFIKQLTNMKYSLPHLVKVVARMNDGQFEYFEHPFEKGIVISDGIPVAIHKVTENMKYKIYWHIWTYMHDGLEYYLSLVEKGSKNLWNVYNLELQQNRTYPQEIYDIVHNFTNDGKKTLRHLIGLLFQQNGVQLIDHLETYDISKITALN